MAALGISATIDERAHLAYQHPPLARIAMAFEPYLAEAHPRGYEGMAEEGREFDARPSGHFALLLARLLGRVVVRQKAVW